MPTQALAQSLLLPPRPDPDGEYGEGLAPFEADGPLIAVVSTGTQQIRVFDRNGMVAASKVSTGRRGYDTPEGVFSIIERKVEHNSNLYDDASMPFMQRITWSGVALHEGAVPGYRASHGCIRLPSGFAERLFRTTKIATRVVIVPHDGVPLAFSHPVLFQPGPPPAAADLTLTAQPAAPAQPPQSGLDGANGQPMMLGATLPPRPDAPPSPEAPAASPPVAAPSAAELKARRIAAERRLAAALKAVSEARVGVRPRLVEQGQAEKALRQAAALAHRAEGRAQALAATVSAAASDTEEASAVAAHLEALVDLAQAKAREEAAREVAAQKSAAAHSVLARVKKLEAERQAAQNESRAIARKLSPVTIFVSRQTGRIYVRQAFREVMDLPVTIRDPDRHLGTHLFTALEADGSLEAVKWVALSLDAPPGVASAETETAPKRRRGESRKPDAPVAARDPLRSARHALDRIEMPQAVLARVMPALQPGSTLIVSDLGPSVETGPGTDVVVQTRGEGQAAQSIANFVAKKKAESAAESAYYSPSARRRDSGWAGPRNWYRW
jgi:hypothetical protein